ncbi:hypothetical protein BBK14_01880 [Parafrankia soli]|uniref:Uncharacterized protein n=1 Tax=Parafrankia soli TaxID=2599596 RepID=A0A1S1RLE0_9ACTN|nr:hypothetical protein [Parafrankia soli]OHV46621.1 hypothetical protein BBK14_01880 [Parafrankia soli]
MPDRSLTFGEIATIAGRSERTTRGWPQRYADFPALGARTEKAIRAWLKAHPGVAGPPARPVPDGGPDRRLSLSRYAVETGRAQSGLYQYSRKAERAGWPERGQPGWFPRPGDDWLYRLGDLVEWDQARPGQGA